MNYKKVIYPETDEVKHYIQEHLTLYLKTEV